MFQFRNALNPDSLDLFDLYLFWPEYTVICIFKVVIQLDRFDRDPDTDHYWLDIGI